MTEVVYQGDSYLMYARLKDGSQIALRGAMRGAGDLPEQGANVTLTLAPEDTILIDGGEG